MYARYYCPDDATLSHVEDALSHSHTSKDVFLLGHVGNQAKARTNSLRMELMKKQMVHEKTNVETWTPFPNQREMNTWQNDISHTINDSKELDADFNFLIIHGIFHWVDQIP